MNPGILLDIALVTGVALLVLSLTRRVAAYRAPVAGLGACLVVAGLVFMDWDSVREAQRDGLEAGYKAANPDAAPTNPPIWAVDFVRVLPGGEEDYLTNIRENWMTARNIALEEGHILSFHALLAKPDSALGWDLMLMTEYADSARWAQREDIFAAIFESEDFEPVDVGRPNSELREFAADAVLRPIDR